MCLWSWGRIVCSVWMCPVRWVHEVFRWTGSCLSWWSNYGRVGDYHPPSCLFTTGVVCSLEGWRLLMPVVVSVLVLLLQTPAGPWDSVNRRCSKSSLKHHWLYNLLKTKEEGCLRHVNIWCCCCHRWSFFTCCARMRLSLWHSRELATRGCDCFLYRSC